MGFYKELFFGTNQTFYEELEGPLQCLSKISQKLQSGKMGEDTN